MHCKEIIAKYLKVNNFDGLFYQGECSCKVDDLMCCDEYCGECEPGYINIPKEGDEWFGECDYVIGRNKEQEGKYETLAEN